ncbi:MAG: hypothetical protein MK132_09465 [Lentisphaerales bacterium]|nr:hypothetical protein [Lentisphaerales bacterium]
MKKSFFIILCISSSLIYGQAPFETGQKNDMEFLKSIILRMDRKIDRLTRKVDALEKQLKEEDDSDEEVSTTGSFFTSFTRRSNGANTKALSKIKLKKDPTESDVLAYLQKISLASNGQNSYSPNDIQVTLLQKIPAKFLEQVVNYQGLQIHTNYALPLMVKKEHKDIVIQNLIKSHSLIKSVIKFGWIDAAWEQLKMGLNSQQHLPREWVTCILQKNKEDGNKAIISYASRSINLELFNTLKYSKISQEELKKAILQNWKIKQYSHQWEASQSAMCAVHYGQLDALERLMRLLNSTDQNSTYQKQQALPILMKLVQYQGDITEWYKANKSKIIFDESLKKFIVKA